MQTQKRKGENMIGKLLSGASAKSLGALSNPASASDIVSGKEAYDANGHKVIGELESLNNPLKPTSQAEYDDMIASKNKIGNYIEYRGETGKIMPEKLSGKFSIGDVVSDVYFDKNAKPTTLPGSTQWDITDVEYSSDFNVNIKYLMVGDEEKAFNGGAVKIKTGIVYIRSPKNAYDFMIYNTEKEVPIYISGRVWGITPGWIFTDVHFDSPITLTTVAESSGSFMYWNGIWAFKTRSPQYARPYYALDTLSSPARSKDIARDKVAYDDMGRRIYGRHEDRQNPFAPKTDTEYNNLIIPQNIGGFFNYNNKIFRLDKISLSGTVAVNDSITGLYFDISKTPAIPDFSSGYEQLSENQKLKHLIKTSDIIDSSSNIHGGLVWVEAISEIEGTIHALEYFYADGAYLIWTDSGEEGETGWDALATYSGDALGFELAQANTVTEISSENNWNGVYVFKKKTATTTEYRPITA